jgi:hypothetical protein
MRTTRHTACPPPRRSRAAGTSPPATPESPPAPRGQQRPMSQFLRRPTHAHGAMAGGRAKRGRSQAHLCVRLRQGVAVSSVRGSKLKRLLAVSGRFLLRRDAEPGVSAGRGLTGTGRRASTPTVVAQPFCAFQVALASRASRASALADLYVINNPYTQRQQRLARKLAGKRARMGGADGLPTLLNLCWRVVMQRGARAAGGRPGRASSFRGAAFLEARSRCSPARPAAPALVPPAPSC